MKAAPLTLGVILLLTSAAAAEDGPALPPALVDSEPSSFLVEDSAEEFALPAIPAGNLLQNPGGPRFWLGARAGYLRPRDADRGTWFGGVQGRYFLGKFVALEGSITTHKSEFLSDDVEVTQFPIQVTGLLFPLPDYEIRPYGLFGAGWYYTVTTYHGPLAGLSNERDNTFGFHVGGGAELELSPKFRIAGDLRYIFMDEPGVDNSQLEDENWDTWQVTLSANFGF